MDYQALLGMLVERFGQDAANKLSDEIRTLVDDSFGWENVVIRILADMIGRHGKEGIVMGIDKVRGLIESDKSSVLIGLEDLVLASDALALLQINEKQERDQVVDFAVKVGHGLNGFIKGILAGG
jgi:hypothetical protein